jgi:hypothetical protein
MDSNVHNRRANQRKNEEDREIGRTKPAPRRKRMPCGATTCLHCHAQCGAVMASYILDGLEQTEDK